MRTFCHEPVPWIGPNDSVAKDAIEITKWGLNIRFKGVNELLNATGAVSDLVPLLADCSVSIGL